MHVTARQGIPLYHYAKGGMGLCVHLCMMKEHGAGDTSYAIKGTGKKLAEIARRAFAKT